MQFLLSNYEFKKLFDYSIYAEYREIGLETDVSRGIDKKAGDR